MNKAEDQRSSNKKKLGLVYLYMKSKKKKQGHWRVDTG